MIESFGSVLLAALVAAEKDTVLAFLKSLFTNDPDLYKAGIFGAKYALKKASVATDKTATKLDDQLIAALNALIAESAAQNGITL